MSKTLLSTRRNINVQSPLVSVIGELSSKSYRAINYRGIYTYIVTFSRAVFVAVVTGPALQILNPALRNAISLSASISHQADGPRPVDPSFILTPVLSLVLGISAYIIIVSSPMSSPEEENHDTTQNFKRRKVQRACDVCRRKKGAF